MWHFPEDRPFNLHDKDGQWAGCRLVEEDADTVTVDYWNDTAQQRMRAQIRKEDIQSVSQALIQPQPQTQSVRLFVKEDALLFQLWDADGHEWRLYANGRVEGFPPGTRILNHAAPMLRAGVHFKHTGGLA